MAVTQKQIEINGVSVSYADGGEGRGWLLLHGGAGPASLNALVQPLSSRCRVIVPTHPGFDGTPRPETLASVKALAAVYAGLLGKLGLDEVVVVGNSMGGWIAAELALLAPERVKSVVLMNAVGIDPGPGKTITSPLSVPPEERAGLSFHDPEKFSFTPASPEALARMAENQKTLAAYSGMTFSHDPGLRARLAGFRVPALVVWGVSDRIVDADYGRRLADSLPGSRFEPVAEAGHFPHVEQTARVLRLIDGFVRDSAANLG